MWLAFWLLCTATATSFLAMASDFEKEMCKNKAVSGYQVKTELTSDIVVDKALKEIANERKNEVTQHLQKPESGSAATLRQNVIFSLTCFTEILHYCSYVCRTGAGGAATISSVKKVKDNASESFKCGQANITVKCGATLPNGVEVTSA